MAIRTNNNGTTQRCTLYTTPNNNSCRYCRRSLRAASASPNLRLTTEITVTKQVDPGSAGNKWFASTATARGHSAPVSPQNGSFAIPAVPVSSGANALTVTVRDASGNIGTQVVHFTALPAQTMAFGYNANGNPTHSSNSLGSPVFTQHRDAENRLARALSDNVMVLECWYDGARRRGGGGGTQTIVLLRAVLASERLPAWRRRWRELRR